MRVGAGVGSEEVDWEGGGGVGVGGNNITMKQDN